MPHLKAVNTSNKEDVTNDLKLRMDISVYTCVKGMSPPARMDFSQTELWMEFKTSGVAFKDPVMFGPGRDECRLSSLTEGSGEHMG